MSAEKKIRATWCESTPEQVEVIYTDGRFTDRKVISRVDYINMVNAHTTDEQIIRVGLTPEGFVDGGWSNTRKTGEVIIQVPAAERLFLYYDESFLIPLPEIIFWFQVKNGHLAKDKIFFCKDGNLYQYVFGNVYPDAHICWGHNTLPEIKSLKDTEKLINLFFSAPTNNDLYHKVQIGSKQFEQHELLAKMEQEKQIPDEFFTKPVMKLSEL